MSTLSYLALTFIWMIDYCHCTCCFRVNFQHIIYCTASLRNRLFEVKHIIILQCQKNRWLNYRDLRLVDTNQWSSALWTFMDSYTSILRETKCDLSKVKCNKSILLVNKNVFLCTISDHSSWSWCKIRTNLRVCYM